MKKTPSFPLSPDFEGRHFSGTVLPSEELAPNGMPIFFRIEPDGQLFAYLCCGDYGWKDRDNTGRSKALIDVIGAYIIDWYE